MASEMRGLLQVRPLSEMDIPALLDLRHNIESVDSFAVRVGPMDLLRLISSPILQPACTSIGLWSGPHMIAYAAVHPPERAEHVVRYFGEGALHPGWRRLRIGTRLIKWMEEHARAMHKSRYPGTLGELILSGLTNDRPMQALMGSAKFAPFLWWLKMERILEFDNVSKLKIHKSMPTGLRIRPLLPGDEEAIRRAHVQSFGNRWAFSVTEEKYFRSGKCSPWQLPESYSFALLDNKDIVAYLLAGLDGEGEVESRSDYHVYCMATSPPYRGSGAGSMLLDASVAAATHRGFRTASLLLDTTNPKRALGLFQRQGFMITCEAVNYGRYI